MLPIVWRATARDDLLQIIRYIANEVPKAARQLKERLESVVLPLAEPPYLYRFGWVPGTRELIANPNYILVYRVAADAVEVVNVLHARQQYP